MSLVDDCSYFISTAATIIADILMRQKPASVTIDPNQSKRGPRGIKAT
jgi:hypothetical protein